MKDVDTGSYGHVCTLREEMVWSWFEGERRGWEFIRGGVGEMGGGNRKVEGRKKDKKDGVKARGFRGRVRVGGEETEAPEKRRVKAAGCLPRLKLELMRTDCSLFSQLNF